MPILIEGLQQIFVDDPLSAFCAVIRFFAGIRFFDFHLRANWMIGFLLMIVVIMRMNKSVDIWR